MVDERVTEERSGGGAPPDEIVRFTVRVVEGASAGAEVVVDGSSGRVLVGTSALCQLVLGDRLVSRRHLAMELSKAGLRLTDLDSRNGTTVDGTRILEALAGHGAVVRVGDAILQVAATTGAEERLGSATSFGRMIGASPVMRRLYPALEKLARTDIPVLVEGEAGVGKELLAEVLHEQGPRAGGPFVVVDPASTSRYAIAEVLFGREPGDSGPGGGPPGDPRYASTSASSLQKPPSLEPGAFEQARGGTLLVKNVEQLPLDLQPRFLAKLRAQQQPGGQPNGAARVVTTSRADLDKEVEQGYLREDLLFALTPGRVELPPLRSRTTDVRLLAEYFWKKLDPLDRSLPADFLGRHGGHTWSGNVRDLVRAVVQRLALNEPEEGMPAAPEEGAAPEHAFAWILEQRLAFPVARRLLLAEFERTFMLDALAAAGGNVSRAAATSGLARRYFQVLRARHRR